MYLLVASVLHARVVAIVHCDVDILRHRLPFKLSGQLFVLFLQISSPQASLLQFIAEVLVHR